MIKRFGRIAFRTFISIGSQNKLGFRSFWNRQPYYFMATQSSNLQKFKAGLNVANVSNIFVGFEELSSQEKVDALTSMLQEIKSKNLPSDLVRDPKFMSLSESFPEMVAQSRYVLAILLDKQVLELNKKDELTKQKMNYFLKEFIELFRVWSLNLKKFQDYLKIIESALLLSHTHQTVFEKYLKDCLSTQLGGKTFESVEEWNKNLTEVLEQTLQWLKSVQQALRDKKQQLGNEDYLQKLSAMKRVIYNLVQAYSKTLLRSYMIGRKVFNEFENQQRKRVGKYALQKSQYLFDIFEKLGYENLEFFSPQIVKLRHFVTFNGPYLKDVKLEAFSDQERHQFVKNMVKGSEYESLKLIELFEKIKDKDTDPKKLNAIAEYILAFQLQHLKYFLLSYDQLKARAQEYKKALLGLVKDEEIKKKLGENLDKQISVALNQKKKQEEKSNHSKAAQNQKQSKKLALVIEKIKSKFSVQKLSDILKEIGQLKSQKDRNNALNWILIEIRHMRLDVSILQNQQFVREMGKYPSTFVQHKKLALHQKIKQLSSREDVAQSELMAFREETIRVYNQCKPYFSQLFFSVNLQFSIKIHHYMETARAISFTKFGKENQKRFIVLEWKNSDKQFIEALLSQFEEVKTFLEDEKNRTVELQVVLLDLSNNLAHFILSYINYLANLFSPQLTNVEFVEEIKLAMGWLRKLVDIYESVPEFFYLSVEYLMVRHKIDEIDYLVRVMNAGSQFQKQAIYGQYLQLMESFFEEGLKSVEKTCLQKYSSKLISNLSSTLINLRRAQIWPSVSANIDPNERIVSDINRVHQLLKNPALKYQQNISDLEMIQEILKKHEEKKSQQKPHNH